MRKLTLAAGAALIVFGSVGTADAQWRLGWGYGGGYRYGGWGGGGAVAAGLVGGAILGAAATPLTGMATGILLAMATVIPLGYGYGYGYGYPPWVWLYLSRLWVRVRDPRYAYPRRVYYGRRVYARPVSYTRRYRRY